MNKKHILIVDDDPGITRTLKLNLEAMPQYAVRVENDSVRALTRELSIDRHNETEVGEFA